MIDGLQMRVHEALLTNLRVVRCFQTFMDPRIDPIGAFFMNTRFG